jgi:peptidoglycan biosynthesis protein MviN/MurJ (putative lipid II flippase)
MSQKHFGRFQGKLYPSLALVGVLTVHALLLRSEGRFSWCGCGRRFLWVSDICSSLNSQTFFDPFSFTHVLHGFVLCGLLALLIPRVPGTWRFSLAVLLEASWEVFENSQFVIDRYLNTETRKLTAISRARSNSIRA